MLAEAAFPFTFYKSKWKEIFMDELHLKALDIPEEMFKWKPDEDDILEGQRKQGRCGRRQENTAGARGSPLLSLPEVHRVGSPGDLGGESDRLTGHL